MIGNNEKGTLRLPLHFKLFAFVSFETCNTWRCIHYAQSLMAPSIWRRANTAEKSHRSFLEFYQNRFSLVKASLCLLTYSFLFFYLSTALNFIAGSLLSVYSLMDFYLPTLKTRPLTFRFTLQMYTYISTTLEIRLLA